MVSKWLERGELTISDEVIAVIAALTAQEIDGVASFVSDIRDDFSRVVNKRGGKRGVFVETNEENETVLTMKVAVDYGVKIAEVCHNVQRAVKEEVEMMTGISVKEVNVSVVQVKFE
ncbi:Asp23/Gls24 family envelope stress response protein [Bacillus tianshenii]|nr:Asp23/Gls24 family envelope stress response protein [Bacillus tianshenii]